MTKLFEQDPMRWPASAVPSRRLFFCASSTTVQTGTTKIQQTGNLSLSPFEVLLVWRPYNNVEMSTVNQYSIFWLTTHLIRN